MPAGESPAARLGSGKPPPSRGAGRAGGWGSATPPGAGPGGRGGGPGAACPPRAAASPLRRCSAGPGAACRAGGCRGRPGLVRCGGRGAGRAMQPGERRWARSLAGQPCSSGCCAFRSQQHVGSGDAGVTGWVSCTQGAAHPAAAQSVHRRVLLPVFKLAEATFKTAWQPAGGQASSFFKASLPQ